VWLQELSSLRCLTSLGLSYVELDGPVRPLQSARASHCRHQPPASSHVDRVLHRARHAQHELKDVLSYGPDWSYK
jgi:hypothetical protein